ncbi:hypothetical protein FACUT_1390 [Fusarium acutatum]|uniref:Rhodopsin domain-containing protein n=1 Tax=Fusarium acutatum TaxID=78861 RepID=A0A8H4K5W1_9HYPO|nr:hypothetical protein FACUT_1390 [Fusarium acutatum]
MPQIEDRPSFIIESWTLYVFGTLVLFARFAVRFKTVGWRGLQGDDFFSVLVLIFYAVDAFTVHLIYYLGTNIEAGVAAKSHTLTKDEIHEYETGSKLELAAWYAYTALIWSLKGTMLCFFSRMTIGTWHNMFVKTVSILCAFSYLAVILTITFGCFPTQKNWHTDALILGIPMPLLWKLQVPFRKKLVIGLLLSSGAFVIAAAITRVVLTLSANPSALTINAWGVRETIVGILTVNIPILRPIFSKSFWNGNAPSEITSSYRTTTHGTRGGNRTLTQDISGPYELTPSINEGSKPSVRGSQDSIVSKTVRMADIVVSKSYHTSLSNLVSKMLSSGGDTQGPEVDGYVSTEVHNGTYAAISPYNFDFDGVAVLITGASRGLGLAMAISFAKAGASEIAIGARSDLSSSSASIFDAASKAGRKRPTILELNMDVSDPASVGGAAAKIRSEFGRLDIVVNSAGILAGDGKIVDSDSEGWAWNFAINTKGLYLVLQAFIPLLLSCEGKKTVVNVSSIGAHCVSPTLSGYQISKLAALRLAEFVTAEYGDKGLLVYSIHPGSVATDMVLQQCPQSPECVSAFADKPELVGDSIVYLTSEKRDWLAGRYINVTWDLPELIEKKEWIVQGDRLKVKISI